MSEQILRTCVHMLARDVNRDISGYTKFLKSEFGEIYDEI